MSSELSLERIRSSVSRVAADFPEIAAVYLYGSQVGGRAMPLSDIDLAVVLVGGRLPDDPLFAERVAARVASELSTAVEVDAHLAERLPLPLQGRVVTTGVLLCERDPSRRVEFETSTRRLYFDFLPFLERDAREGLRAGG